MSHAERGYLRAFLGYVERRLDPGDAESEFALTPPVSSPGVDGVELQRLVRRALADADWAPLLAVCEAAGRRASEQGAPLAAWYDWTSEFRGQVSRTLCVGTTEDRRYSWRVLEGLALYQAFVMEAVEQGYLRARE